MKITDIRTLVLGTPWRNLSYLILETDEGLTGIGEARVVGKTHTVLQYLQDVKRHIVGYDPFDIEALYRRLTLLDFGKAGEVVYTGLAMVEMACWDLKGKATGQPVWKLLGGRAKDGSEQKTVQAYANGWYTVERSPEQFAKAAKVVVAKGYKAMKFDPFGSGDLELERAEFHRSIELIEAVHEAVGDKAQLLIEMHGRFTPRQAVEIARRIEPLSPGWIEEPTRPEHLQALREVHAHTMLPVATGERLYGAAEFRELFRLGGVDIIQPDITQCGGVWEVKKIASTAETHSIMVAPHNVGGIVSTMAALHLMITLRNGKILEHFNDFTDVEVQQAGSGYPVVTDGYFSLPDKPGWGVELDEDFIRAHPPQMVDGVVQDPGLDMFRKADWNVRGQGGQ